MASAPWLPDGAYLSPSMTSALLRKATPGLAELTPAESRILNMISAGKPTSVIAAELHIHQRTVDTHRANTRQNLKLSGANSLLRFALEHKSELLG